MNQEASSSAQHPEIEHWLATKFNEEWVNERAASHLNEDLLNTLTTPMMSDKSENTTRFHYLDTPVKIRILMSCIAMKKKQITQLAPKFQNLLECAKNDSEDWVKVVASFLSAFPSSNAISTDIESTLFQQTIQDFETKCQMSEKSPKQQLMPIISKFLNSESSAKYCGPAKHSHFKLKKRDDLMAPIKMLNELTPAPSSDQFDSSSTDNGESSSQAKDPKAMLKAKLQQQRTPVKRPLPTTKPSPNAAAAKKLPLYNKRPGVPHPGAISTASSSTEPSPSTPTPKQLAATTVKKAVTPRVMKQLDSVEAIAKMQEQHDSKRRRAPKNEENEAEKERKKRERQEAKEKKELEKQERKRKREEEKKRKQEEAEARKKAKRARKEQVQQEVEEEEEEEDEEDEEEQEQPQKQAAPSTPMQHGVQQQNPFALHQFGMMNPFAALQQQQQQAGAEGMQKPDSSKLQQMLQEALGQTRTNPFAPNLFHRPQAQSTQQQQQQQQQQQLPTKENIPNMEQKHQQHQQMPQNLSGMQSSGFPSMLSPLFFNPQNRPGLPSPSGNPFSANQMSALQNLQQMKPQLPSMPNQQQMPQMPQIPQMPQMPQMPQIPQMPQTNKPFFSGLGLPIPGMPQQQQQQAQPQPQQQPPKPAQPDVDTICNNLLRGCNKVTATTRMKVLNFLAGKKDPMVSGNIDEVLLHEELKAGTHENELHQIYLQVDYSNGSWKKFLKKITQ